MSQQEQNDKSQHFYRASAADFMKIPGSPVAYWVSPTLRNVFEDNINLCEVADVKQGLATADNDRFLRLWFEVSKEKISLTCNSRSDSISSGARWYPHSKGGEFRKWYGNREWLVNWENDGEELFNFRPRSVIRSPDKYFQECITWTLISSSSTAFRYEPMGNIIGHKGPGIFTSNALKDLSAFLNSKVAFHILKILAPTIGFEVGQVSLLPIIQTQAEASKIIEIATTDWNLFENSWDFTYLHLLSLDCSKQNIKNTYKVLCQNWLQSTLLMQKLEEENNRTFICIYQLADELSPEVPLEEITLTCNPHYRYGGNRAVDELETLLQCDTIKELLSYIVGCMMGRYSIDKPGLILASQGETLQDYLNQIPKPRFMPDNDAILPLTDQEWFVDDVTNRVREFVKVVWGEDTLAENLTFIAESLCLHAIKPLSAKNSRGESSIETIRRYLSTQFYKDHLKTYKKRPIYWLFSSGKEKAFECLVYLHRYNESTLARMRTEYVTPLMGKYDAQQSLLQEQLNDASPAQQRELEKQLKDLAKKQTELRAFDENLKHYADMRIKLDLDDGVKVNYGKFGNLLADVKAITGDKE